MKKLMPIITGIILPSLFVCQSLVADSSSSECRCSGFLIQIGDHQYKVRKYCGEPTAIESIGQREVITDGQTQKLNLDDWIYERDGNTIVIRFEGGRIVRIETIE